VDSFPSDSGGFSDGTRRALWTRTPSPVFLTHEGAEELSGHPLGHPMPPPVGADRFLRAARTYCEVQQVGCHAGAIQSDADIAGDSRHPSRIVKPADRARGSFEPTRPSGAPGQLTVGSGPAFSHRRPWRRQGPHAVRPARRAGHTQSAPPRRAARLRGADTSAGPLGEDALR
jgi:hypothetical protein